MAAASEAAFSTDTITATFGMTVHHTYPIDRVVLLRPAAVTHAFDIDQRYIELNFTPTSAPAGVTTYAITSPTEDLAPPRWCMLSAVQAGPLGRVPSVAWWIHIT